MGPSNELRVRSIRFLRMLPDYLAPNLDAIFCRYVGWRRVCREPPLLFGSTQQFWELLWEAAWEQIVHDACEGERPLHPRWRTRDGRELSLIARLSPSYR